MAQPKGEAVIGKKVHITDSKSIWYKFYGTVLAFDGDYYHIGGGCISRESDPDLVPIFDRDQFVLRTWPDRISD